MISSLELFGYILVFVAASVLFVGGIANNIGPGFTNTDYSKLGGSRKGIGCRTFVIIGALAVTAWMVLELSARGR